MPAGLPEPAREYQRRLDERRAAVARLQTDYDRLALARGLVFLAGVGMLIGVFGPPRLAPGWLVLPAGLFVGLVVAHARVAAQLDRVRQAVAWYETGLARIADRWIGTGPTGERYADPEHSYSGDLDLFGRGSLFQLLSAARTRIGEDTLAAWLGGPADVATLRSRQRSVEELRPETDFREELALLDAEVHDHLDQNRLRRWAQQPPHVIPRAHRIAAGLLGTAAVLAVVGWAVFNTGLAPLLVVLMAEMLFLFSFQGRLRPLAEEADEAGSGLAILAQVLDLMESRRFETPLLADLRGRLDTEGLPPSRTIAQLRRQIAWLNNSFQNQFFALIAFALCLPVHLVHAVELWRARVGTHIPDWLDAVGQFEALASLAGYSYEHPDDPFPELLEGEPRFEGEELGHPLLPQDRCVRNDLSLGGELRLILVSGSNMSGKSTLLRTIGSNVVLAQVGAPVRAARLRLTPFQLGTAMRVNDSLQQGASLFYAVVRRLKMVVELTGGTYPLLFLLDEILQGTNSHDRRIGAEGVIRNLVESGAVGLVTTHDLALTEIVESLGERAKNIHFEDRLVEGRMLFDYRIRPGVVQRSNALELMRMMGLDV